MRVPYWDLAPFSTTIIVLTSFVAFKSTTSTLDGWGPHPTATGVSAQFKAAFMVQFPFNLFVNLDPKKNRVHDLRAALVYPQAEYLPIG